MLVFAINHEKGRVGGETNQVPPCAVLEELPKYFVQVLDFCLVSPGCRKMLWTNITLYVRFVFTVVCAPNLCLFHIQLASVCRPFTSCNVWYNVRHCLFAAY